MDKIDSLIDLLFDPTAREDERDDAARYLGNYDDDRALNALITYSINNREKQEHDAALEACGESIAEIWMRKNHFDLEIYKSLSEFSQQNILGNADQ